MNIVVLGNRQAGKSSILKLVFQKISSNETLFLESTSKIEEYTVRNNNYTQCSFFDFPGTFEISQMNSLERKYLQNASAMLYILDSKDEPYNKTLEKFLTLVSEVNEMNPSCVFELLIHKLDGQMFSTEDSKIIVLDEIKELIKLNSSERNLPLIETHMTSIHDLSIYICLSRILQKSNPILMQLQELFDVFISECNIDKIYVIDIISKLYIASDSTPIDLLSYELCIDMIEVAIGISTLYG